MSVGILVAIDPTGLMGVDGQLPWHYSADLKRFKRLTMGGTVIMGHTTWESLPKPLPGRRCLVLTRGNPQSRHPLDACSWFSNLEEALHASEQDSFVWVIGGASVYAQALQHPKVEFVDLTLVPVATYGTKQQALYFPKEILQAHFELVSQETNLEDECLTHCRYERSDALAASGG